MSTLENGTVIDQTVGQSLGRAIAERTDRELDGAYQAGYDCCTIGWDQNAPATYTEIAPADYVDNARIYRWEQYYLGNIDPVEYRTMAVRSR